MKSRLPKIFFLTLVMALCLTCLAKGGQTPIAQRGLLDLRKADLFSKQLSINGEWGFYWNRLLSPDSLSAVAPAYVPYPVLWKDLTLNGEKVPSQGYATYTLTVLLPAKRPRIGLEVPDTYCTYKLFVNGVVQAQNGQPATTKEKARPFWVTRTFVLPSGESDTLVMVLQIANFWHARGGPYKDILLGDKDELILKKYRDSAYDFLLAGCLFMGGIVFLGVMFFCIAYSLYVYLQAARNRRSGSLFALLSTTVMLFIGLLMNLHYFGIIPDLRLILFICYISFFFLQSLALSHRFAHTFRQATFLAQQGLRAKSEFLSTMSHEIRTPLNAVIGMTHLLLRNRPRTDQEEDLGVLLFSANNLLSIVNNILDYNKIEEGKIGFEHISFDLSATARNIMAGLKNAADGKGIALLIDIDQNLNNKLLGDPTRTTQVINNLAHNAIKFTREGSVSLSLVVDSVWPDAMTITVKIEDTGIGIAPEKQQMIFDRFTQADSSTSRSYGGTGLGLAITKKILELQGVLLQLKSEPGKGSCFYFTQTFSISTEVGGERRNILPVNGQEM